MDITDIVPVTRVMTIGGKEYKIARLTLRELFVEMEKLVRDEYLKNVKEIATTLEGRDKTEFLKEATRSMPKGTELNTQVQDYLTTIDGIAKLLHMSLVKNHSNMTLENVYNIITSENMEQIRFALEFITGSDTLTDTEDKKK